MILVQIDIPVLQRKLDFSLNEYAPVQNLIHEIIQILQKKYNDDLDDSMAEGFDIYVKSQELCLERDTTLAEHGVVDGTELLLV